MKALHFSILLAACAFLGAGCLTADAGDDADAATDPDSDAAPDVEDPDADEESTIAALCAPFSSAPAPDWTYEFTGPGANLLRTVNYGPGLCANYVVRLIYDYMHTAGSPRMSVTLVDALPADPYRCVATSVTLRRYNGSSAITVTTNAEWTAQGCVLPPAEVGGFLLTSSNPITTVELSAQRAMVCPPGSVFCYVAAHALPVKIRLRS